MSTYSLNNSYICDFTNQTNVGIFICQKSSYKFFREKYNFFLQIDILVPNYF